MRTFVAGSDIGKLDRALAEVNDLKRNAEADVLAELERAKKSAELAANADRVKLSDLLPTRWHELFRPRLSREDAFEKLTTAHGTPYHHAIENLKGLNAIVEPFRSLCASLAVAHGSEALELEDLAAAQGLLDERERALARLYTLKTAIEAAGDSDIAKRFPIAQVEAIEAALNHDTHAIEARIGALRDPPPILKSHHEARDRRLQAVALGVVQKDIVEVDKHGPLEHLGQPIQFGAEKERNMASMSSGDTLASTSLADFDPTILGTAKQWSDLDDRGKSEYTLAYKKKRGRWPDIKVIPNEHYKDLSIEPNGWIEVISEKFDTLKQAKTFLSRFGWGHVHTSWMRGAAPEVQKSQVAWMRNANLYMFLHALESRGASGNDGPYWRFSIKGLSIPTEENLKLALELIQGRTFTATPFSKHLHIGLRASGLYGDRNRIGFEARGGNDDEKKRVIDSLLNGLVFGKWGKRTDRFGEGEFRLISEPTNFVSQQRTVPREFATLIESHLRAHPSEKVKPEDANSLRDLVASARFKDGLADLPIEQLRSQEPPARILGFDHRVATPLLNYEAIAWLTDEEKHRAIEARGHFIERLAKLSKDKFGKTKTELATKIAGYVAEWAKEAELSEPFGRWLDGVKREQFIDA